MRLIALALLGAISLAAAAPYVISNHQSSIGSGQPEQFFDPYPPSAQAKQLKRTIFELVAFTLPKGVAGCPQNVTHDQISNVPPTDIGENGSGPEGYITFGNITVNGNVCESSNSNQRLALFSQDVVDTILPGGKVLDLDRNATQAILIAGIDRATRKCGSYQDDFIHSYAFTTNIAPVLLSLANSSYLATAEIPADVVQNGTLWMISARQDAPGRICLFKRSDKELPARNPDRPSRTPEVTEPPNSSPPGTPKPSTVFEEANEDGIEQEKRDEMAKNSSKCFPATATVRLEDDSQKDMAHLEIGDRVLVARNTFSEVFMFTHKFAKGKYSFVQIVTDTADTLTLTNAHYIYLNGNMATAGTAVVGDSVQLGDGSLSTISSTSIVELNGLYNPQTVHGDIIVNNIRASTYTRAINPSTAHALLAPLRGVFSKFSLVISYFEEGSNRLVDLVPEGRLVY